MLIKNVFPASALSSAGSPRRWERETLSWKALTAELRSSGRAKRLLGFLSKKFKVFTFFPNSNEKMPFIEWKWWIWIHFSLCFQRLQLLQRWLENQSATVVTLVACVTLSRDTTPITPVVWLYTGLLFLLFVDVPSGKCNFSSSASLEIQKHLHQCDEHRNMITHRCGKVFAPSGFYVLEYLKH